MSFRININDCLWLRSAKNDGAPYLRWFAQALEERGASVFVMRDSSDREGLKRLKDLLWRSDVHVIIDVMLSDELKALYPIFKTRKNFSLAMMDWWTSSFWYKQHAEYLLFRNYNGISTRLGLSRFAEGQQLPLLSLPDQLNSFQVAGSLARLPALTFAPFIELSQWLQRRCDRKDKSRFIYFPFSIAPEQVALKPTTIEYDFANASSTTGYWIMRDPYAPARYTFANLYADRRRLTDMILKFEHRPYRVFDLRREAGHLSWGNYSELIQKSRYAIATGGMHQASLPKFLEQVCLGTPCIGPLLPFEFPWLRECSLAIDPMRTSNMEVKAFLEQAMECHSTLHANCLANRERLLAMYSADRLINMAQAQIDGQPIPVGYLTSKASESPA